MRWQRSGWHGTMAATIAIALQAQGVSVHTLTKPNAELTEPFSQVSGVRELRDGRVVVVDRLGATVYLADFRAATLTKIGRDGEGPGEYRLPLKLFALPGDSTAIHDGGNARGNLVITPDGKPGGLLSPNGPDSRGVVFNLLSDVDGRGTLYHDVTVFHLVGGKQVMSDSMGIERWDRVSTRRDTVAMYSRHIVSPLWRTPAGAAVASSGGASRRATGVYPFASVDQWAVAPNGTLAVVSVEPYRARFVDPSGVRREGPRLAVQPVPVTAALKAEWRAAHQRPVPTLSRVGTGPTMAGMTKPRYTEPGEWPDVLPPFLQGAVSFAPDGMLWVQRTHAADAAPSCDLIDATGRIVSRVALPKHSRVVGFGARSVYLVRIDDDDLEYLQRFPLPAR